MKKAGKIILNEKMTISQRRVNFLASALIIFPVIIVYGVFINNSFQFDDIPRIIKNNNLRDFSSLKAEYPFLHGKRAVVNYTLWLNGRLGGFISSKSVSDELELNVENCVVWKFRLLNILLHCANGILVYFLCLKIQVLTGLPDNNMLRNYASLGVALLYTLHPIQTQAVIYIIQRAELLAAFFQFLGLLCYLTARVKRKLSQIIPLITATVIFYVLALESKEQSAIFPVVIFLFEIFILKKEKRNRLSVLSATTAILIIITLVFLYNLSITYKGDTSAGFAVKSISRGNYALTNVRVLFTYLRLLIIPVNQNLDYDYPPSTSFISPPATLIAFIVFLAIVFYAILMSKKHPRYSFCIFFFLVTLAPSSGLIPIADLIFEHRLYLPSFGFLFLIALLAEKAYSFLKKGNFQKAVKVAYIFSASLILVVCIILTIRRNFVWQTPLTLWQDVVEKSPNKARGYVNLGHEQFSLFKKDRQRAYTSQKSSKYLNDALQNFEKAIRLDPKQPDAYTNLSLVYYELDRGDEALMLLEQTIKLDPENPERYLKLADMYYRLSKYKEAVDYFEDIFRKNHVLKNRFQNYEKLKNAMAKIYLAYGMSLEFNNSGERYGEGFPYAETVEAYKKSLEWEPLPDVYYSLAVVYDRTQHFQLAVIYYRRVLEMKHDYQYAEIIRNRIKEIESLN